MSDLDARLQELALAKGGREYVLTRSLIAALLRARQALADVSSRTHHEEGVVSAQNEQQGEFSLAGSWSERCQLYEDCAVQALADTELEEAIK